MGSLSGCLGVPQVDTPIHQSSQGQVILKTFTDTTVKASHPATIDPELLYRFLRGLRVLEQKELLAALVSGEGQELPVFTEEEILFLAPILMNALTRATPEEFVWFRLENRKQPNPSFTSGAMYLSDQLLRFGLDEFQADHLPNKLSSKPSFSATRLRNWSLEFFPADVNRSARNGTQISPIPAHIGSVAISLKRLQHIDNPPQQKVKEDRLPQTGIQAQDNPNNRIQDMQKEIGELQQQLKGQNRQLKKLEQELERSKGPLR